MWPPVIGKATTVLLPAILAVAGAELADCLNCLRCWSCRRRRRQAQLWPRRRRRGSGELGARAGTSSKLGAGFRLLRGTVLLCCCAFGWERTAGCMALLPVPWVLTLRRGGLAAGGRSRRG